MNDGMSDEEKLAWIGAIIVTACLGFAMWIVGSVAIAAAVRWLWVQMETRDQHEGEREGGRGRRG